MKPRMVRSWFWLVVLVAMIALGVGCAYRAAGALGVAIYAPFLGAAVADALTPLGVRVCKRQVRESVKIRRIDGSVLIDEEQLVTVGYGLLRWIIPLTGWWTDYRYIARRS